MQRFLRPVKDIVKDTPLWPVIRPRRLHGYNLGAPRTGTTTVARILGGAFRAVHEPMPAKTITLLKQHWHEGLPRSEIQSVLRKRDQEHRFEFESSPYLGPFAAALPETFPEAKFVLTVRRPRSWLRSIVDRCINFPRSELAEPYTQLRDFCCEPPRISTLTRRRL
jgi:hypothetical protein